MIVVARGAIDRRGGGDEANLIINEIVPLDQLDANFKGDILIRIDERQHGTDGLTNLREILRGYPGTIELNLNLGLEDGTSVELAVKVLKVEMNSELKSRVTDLLGDNALQLRPKIRQARAPQRNGKRRTG